MDPGSYSLHSFARDDEMKVHYIYCHPVPESFHAATEALADLKDAGHTIAMVRF